jgi:glycosyltransferase involved in cell wall biosynthesis
VRVLLYSRAFPPAVGGIERFAESLAFWLGERGHAVWVVTDTISGSLEPDRPFRVARRVAIGRARSLARAADVVHVNGLSLRGMGLGMSSRRPVVVTHEGHQAVCPTGLCISSTGNCPAGPDVGPCGGCPDRGLKGTADVRAHRAACQAADLNVAASEYLRRRLGLAGSRTIYNPVAKQAFDASTDAPGEDGLIAFAGRLVSEKGLNILLRALVSVPDARLEILGDGPMGQAYRNLADELGISLRVSFLGSKGFGGVAEAYARASVVCVPSAGDEPFGFAAAEAMAMRRPLVVTPSGALVEMCAERRGFLAAGRDPAALATALQDALAGPHERLDRAARGRAFAVERFSADRVGIAYESAYEELAS